LVRGNQKIAAAAVALGLLAGSTAYTVAPNVKAARAARLRRSSSPGPSYRQKSELFDLI
jgi:hypothetical protein